MKGQLVEGVRLASPFVLRTFDPPIRAAAGKRVREVRRQGVEVEHLCR